MDIQDCSLFVTSPSFKDGGEIPLKHTGFSYDVSPAFEFKDLNSDGKSITITLDDLDIPFIKEYNHWLIFNIPLLSSIPENVPYGAEVESFGGAKQGIAYGKNRYRGPKIPFFISSAHRYVFTFYVLDCMLPLDSNCHKKDVLNAMEGHIIQKAQIMCSCRRPPKKKK